MNRSLQRVLLAGAAIAVPATINAVLAARAGRFQGSLPGDIAYYEWIYGRVAFYRIGHGDPLVLVHNPNAGGSAWEWRKVVLEFANRYTVYALDLLGFGLSEKPNIRYTGMLYADLLHDFLQDVVERPAMGMGSSLGASYLVNVAVRRPEALTKLVLVNPTGCTSTLPAAAEVATHAFFNLPIVGESAYYTLVSRANIDRELKEHVFYDPLLVTPEMVDTLYRASHQHGARHAASAFIAGRLDLAVRMAFSLMKQPTLLVWGRDAFYTPVGDAMDLLYRHPEARLEILDECGMLPHDELAGEFLRLAGAFLQPSVGGEAEAA